MEQKNNKEKLTVGADAGTTFYTLHLDMGLSVFDFQAIANSYENLYDPLKTIDDCISFIEQHDSILSDKSSENVIFLIEQCIKYTY